MVTNVNRVGWHYERARVRIDALLRSVGPTAWETPVQACPGWRVRDVVAHLFGVTEDGAAGRIRGVPDEALTAEQVERHRHDDVAVMLDAWAAVSPLVADTVSASERWPAAIDVVTHEHDLRRALDRPGARDDDSVVALAARLAASVGGPTPISFDLGDRTVRAGTAAGGGTPLVLHATPFEVLRLRMGRRSLGQVRALDWSGDPEPVLAHLFVFGPASDALAE